LIASVSAFFFSASLGIYPFNFNLKIYSFDAFLSTGTVEVVDPAFFLASKEISIVHGFFALISACFSFFSNANY